MKIIHLFTVCLVMIFSITSNYAQQMNSANKGLGITVGYNYGYFKDLNFSPLNYQQKGLAIAFDYTFPNKRNGDLFNIHLDFSPNTIETTTAEYFTADFFNGTIQFDYLKKVKNNNSKLTTYLGGQFSSNNSFVFWEGTNSFTYNFAHSLSMKGQVGWKFLIFTSCEKAVIGTAEVNDPENNFELFWHDFDEHYALFDVRGMDWEEQYEKYRPQVTAQTTDQELWEIMTQMIAVLDDGHTFLLDRKTYDESKEQRGFFGSGSEHYEQVEAEFSKDLIYQKYVENITDITGDL